jgi:hypothetical protein
MVFVKFWKMLYKNGFKSIASHPDVRIFLKKIWNNKESNIQSIATLFVSIFASLIPFLNKRMFFILWTYDTMIPWSVQCINVVSPYRPISDELSLDIRQCTFKPWMRYWRYNRKLLTKLEIRQCNPVSWTYDR